MLLNNYSLKQFNSMGIDVLAGHFAVVQNEIDLCNLLERFNQKKILALGSGSNILFTKNFYGLVIKNEITGIEILEEDDTSVRVRAGAGVIWNDFVLYSVRHNLSGIENLALIPGTVGAAPVQNIGAYGQEIKNVLIEIEAYNLNSGTRMVIPASDCSFEYRGSIFKKELQNKLFITSVVFELKKQFVPVLSYPDLSRIFNNLVIDEITLSDVMNAVIKIRQRKLPDPVMLGNCGSFFKNPVISEARLKTLLVEFPGLRYFESNGSYKISAGWLIEKCGWRGKKIGNVGCYKDHSLVIVNYGNATGEEVYQFSLAVKESVYRVFGISLENEVLIL